MTPIARQPAAEAPAVETTGLTKRYGTRVVLHDVSLTVQRGALFGFLGPNGAGKTTTIRILLGLLRATSGAARIFGLEAWRQGAQARRVVGYLPGDIRFYDGLTGRQTLRFLDGVRGGGGQTEAARLAGAFDLDLSKRVRSLSRGTKQKLGLVAALMHAPRLLVLDEPTNALDPLVRAMLYDELRRYTQGGGTVLFSSHTLSEVEALCDEVAVLRSGRLIEHERIDVLRQRAVRHVEVRLPPRPVPAPPPELHVRQRTEAGLIGSWSGPIEPLIAWLHAAGAVDAVIAPPDLEDLFMAYYSDPASSARQRSA